MAKAVLMVQMAAAALAMVSAIFGVFFARLIWAKDLEHAKRIDAIRSETEQHLEGTIKALEHQIRILEGRDQ